jgi:integrase
MINRQNYHWIKAYLDHLQTVMQINARSLERYWSYLRHALLWADETSFGQAPHIRPAFSAYLAEVRLTDSDEPLAPATLKKIFQITQRFFRWARLSFPREFQAVSTAWIESLRLPRQTAVVKEHEFVTLDDIGKIARLAIPEPNVALRRDQACAVMLYLSGMRVGAMGTLPIEAVDLAERSVRQWPSLGVYTKNGKAATTYLLPIQELLEVVRRWDAHVRETLPPTAMWCPPVAHTWGDQTLTAERPGANRHIAINKRLRLLFSLADLPPRSPHKFRHGHAVWALQHARTMADYKAISQNLMHSDIRVTDGIYAPLLGNEVQQRVAGLAGQASHPLSTEGDLVEFLSRLSKAEIPAALHVLADRLAQ